MKTILTDIDGVILDWFNGFIRFLINENIPIQDHVHLHEYNIEEWLHDEDVVKLIRRFNMNRAFEELPAYNDALIYLPKIAALGYEFIGITSCGNNRITKIRRENNINAIFPNIFKDIHCIPFDADKTHWLEEFNSSIWCEDKTSNAIKGYKAQHETYIFNRIYNLNDSLSSDIIRVDGWGEIYKILKERRENENINKEG